MVKNSRMEFHAAMYKEPYLDFIKKNRNAQKIQKMENKNKMKSARPAAVLQKRMTGLQCLQTELTV